MPDTFDIPDVEIFAAGTFHKNSDKEATFDEDDLQRIVDDTNAIEGRAPYVRTGLTPPSDEQHSDDTMSPRFGTLKNIRRVGNKIVADLMRVPRSIVRAMKNGGLPGRSVEMTPNYQGKYPYVLKALALIGNGHQEVKTLADVDALYASEGDEKSVYFFTEAEWPSDKEKVMPESISTPVEETPVEEPIVEAEAEEKEEDTSELDALKAENKRLSDENAALKSENGDMVDRVGKLEEKDANTTVDAVMSELGREGKVLPAEADMIRADLLDKYTSPRMLSFGEKTEDAYKATVAQLKEREVKIDFTEKSANTGEPGASKEPSDEQLAKRGMTREQHDKVKHLL
jgi:hypothetical protein